MSASNEATLSTLQSALFGVLQKTWGWLLAWGILSLVLGTLGFYMTFGLTLASVLFFGILLVVGGLVQLVVRRSRRAPERLRRLGERACAPNVPALIFLLVSV